jgi:uncharacterized RDD family membrane protein YckC
MRCPKCHYISFDSSTRCRNCGYEFSLAPVADEIELPIQTGNEAIGPLTDFSLEHSRAPNSSGSELSNPSASELSALRSAARTGPDRKEAMGAPDLPLFKDRGLAADAPFVTSPAVPRAPLSVRRASPPMARSRPRATVDEPVLNLEMPDLPARTTPGVRISPSVPTAEREDVVGAHQPPLQAAAAGRRLLAASIDSLLLASINASVLYFTLKVSGLVFAEIGVVPAIPLAAYLLLLDGGYYVAFTATGGQTMGKMAAGIKVVPVESTGDENDRVSLGQAVLRAAASVVSVLPAGLGFLPALVGADRRALHDWLAATRVVKA